MALFLSDFLRNEADGGSKKLRILDIAPSAPLSRLIRNKIAEYGLDCSYLTADLEMAGVDERLNVENMECHGSNSLDLFLCSHVLEHVRDDRRAMRELYRVLSPSGVGVLLVPLIRSLAVIEEDPQCSDEGERWQRFGQGDHVRLYSKAGFVSRLVNAGFAVTEWGVAELGRSVMRRCGIQESGVLYVVRKMHQRHGEEHGGSNDE